MKVYKLPELRCLYCHCELVAVRNQDHYVFEHPSNVSDCHQAKDKIRWWIGSHTESL